MTARPTDSTPNQSASAIDLIATPMTWEQIAHIFPQPISELEIGSGKGLFLQSAAQEYPLCGFLGIELSQKFANRAAERLARLGIQNAMVLRADAQQFLSDIAPHQAFRCVHVYFPDPWWRNKHKKRRLLNQQTLEDIQRVLLPGGQLHFWTDALDYYEHLCGQIMELTQLLGPRYVPERPAGHTMDYTTHFERRARLSGQPVYRAVFEKM